MLRKCPPCLRPAGRDFAQAGCPSLPVYDRKKITKEGYKGRPVLLERITEESRHEKMTGVTGKYFGRSVSESSQAFPVGLTIPFSEPTHAMPPID
jgi:hypothetical protein